MLEPFDYKALGMVSSFIRGTVHWLCRLDCNSVTKMLTLYADLLSSVYQMGMRPEQTERDLRKLSKSIDDFKCEACRVFENYLPSGNGTMKSLLREHLTEDLQSVVTTESLHAGLSGATYKWFKKLRVKIPRSASL